MTPPPEPAEPARPVDALADAYVEESAALDPVLATMVGVAGHEHELPDLSPDGFAARAALVRETLRRVRAATPTDERERSAKEAFVERLALDVERDEAGVTASQVSVIDSALHDVRACFDLMSTDTEDDWSAVGSRLRRVPETLAGYRRTLLEEARHGHVSARRQYLAVAHQVRGWTGQGGSRSVFAALVAHAPERLRSELATAADAATGAYADFGRFLADELAPRGRVEDAVGRERYRLDSRYFLGAEIDLEETYAWGWEELHRIETEMAQIARELVPDATTLEEAGAALDADPDRTIEGAEAFRDWMQQLADETVAELAGTHFDVPEPVRRIECRIAPTHDGGIYYTGPSEDFTRPGRMWWSVPEGVTRFSPWREVTTVYHEGVPGHHLQVGQTCYRRELLNRWQRQMGWVSGSGEGWALYAERLMDELGYLTDPADRLGMLDAQGFRAARVVGDIGLHLKLRIPDDNPFAFHPGETWDADLLYAFMRAHCRMDDATIRFEVDRYLGWPGQAPSYKVGERWWRQARAEVEQRRGADFDLATFHREALDLGSIGLDPLMAALRRL